MIGMVPACVSQHPHKCSCMNAVAMVLFTLDTVFLYKHLRWEPLLTPLFTLDTVFLWEHIQWAGQVNCSLLSRFHHVCACCYGESVTLQWAISLRWEPLGRRGGGPSSQGLLSHWTLVPFFFICPPEFFPCGNLETSLGGCAGRGGGCGVGCRGKWGLGAALGAVEGVACGAVGACAGGCGGGGWWGGTGGLMTLDLFVWEIWGLNYLSVGQF